MTIVIKESHGEYEDYTETIIDILNVETSKTLIELEAEHKTFLVDLLNQHGIQVQPNDPWRQIGRNKKSKLHITILKNNSFYDWLKINYVCKSVGDFIEVFNN